MSGAPCVLDQRLRRRCPIAPRTRWTLLGPRNPLVAVVALAAALLLGGCGDTLQDQRISPAPFENVMVQSRFPVYWVGLRFERLAATSVITDPSEAVTIHYGDCLVGGQYTCVTPLSIVTSPDNSFLPGDSALASALRIRGLRAASLQGGGTIVLATGHVVVSIYADSPALARAAARTMTPLNQAVPPGARLPKPLPATDVGRTPLRSELPPGA